MTLIKSVLTIYLIVFLELWERTENEVKHKPQKELKKERI